MHLVRGLKITRFEMSRSVCAPCLLEPVGERSAISRQAAPLVEVLDFLSVRYGQRHQVVSVPVVDAGIQDYVGRSLRQQLYIARRQFFNYDRKHVWKRKF